MSKSKKKKVNPLRRPATAADIKAAKKAAFDAAISHNWAVFFTVMMDKEGASNETLNQVWDDVSDIADIIDRRLVDVPTLLRDLEANGVELGEARRKVIYRKKGQIDVSSVRAAQKQAMDEAILYTWVLFFTALKNGQGMDRAALSRIWQEVQYLEDSIRNGYVDIKDLMETLEEENGITLID